MRICRANRNECDRIWDWIDLGLENRRAIEWMSNWKEMTPDRVSIDSRCVFRGLFYSLPINSGKTCFSAVRKTSLLKSWWWWKNAKNDPKIEQNGEEKDFKPLFQ